MEDQVKMIVTPKQGIGYYLIRNLWMFVVYLLIFIIGLIAKVTIMKSIPEIEKSMNAILNGALIVFGILIVVVYFYMTLKMYINTRIIKYVFYNEYVKYVDNFWNKESKTISYDNITEVSMRQPIWDRILGTGTIYLKTPVERGVGIFMNYVDDPEDIEDSIRKIINNNY